METKKLYKVPHYRLQLVRESGREYCRRKAASFDDAASLFRHLLADLPHEELCALFMNGSNRIIGSQTISVGGQAGAACTPADVFRGAIAVNASAIILGHNHPSGDAAPSPQDVRMTRQLHEAGKLLGVTVLDHVVVAQTPGGWACTSLRDAGAFD